MHHIDKCIAGQKTGIYKDLKLELNLYAKRHPVVNTYCVNNMDFPGFY